jgi:hypothetical protein
LKPTSLFTVSRRNNNEPFDSQVAGYGKGTDPAGKPRESKSITKSTNDERVFTLSVESDEPESEIVKMMEITCECRPK